MTREDQARNESPFPRPWTAETITQLAEYAADAPDRDQSAMLRDLVDVARVAATALRASSVSPQGWQSIESAPKDGTRILLLDGNIVRIGYWCSPAGFELFEQRDGWQIFECEDGCYSLALDADEATHWMPLPSAPKDTTK